MSCKSTNKTQTRTNLVHKFCPLSRPKIGLHKKEKESKEFFKNNYSLFRYKAFGSALIFYRALNTDLYRLKNIPISPKWKNGGFIPKKYHICTVTSKIRCTFDVLKTPRPHIKFPTKPEMGKTTVLRGR